MEKSRIRDKKIPDPQHWMVVPIFTELYSTGSPALFCMRRAKYFSERASGSMFSGSSTPGGN
jgi:hypothetical protein